MIMREGHQGFDEKWGDIIKKEKSGEEISIFVDIGERPKTFRQFHSFCYFDFIKQTIESRRYKKSLEVGCGRGTASLYLNKYLDFDVTLVDISEDAIKLAEYNFNKYNAQGKILVADSERLPFEDSTFDIVVSIGLAEHFKDYTQLFKEQYRVLRSGGMMISLNIPKKFSIQSANSINKFFRKFFFHDKQVKKDYFRNTDSPEAYEKKAKEAGFGNVYSVNINPFPLFTPFPKNIEKRIVKLYNQLYNFRKKTTEYPLKTARFIAASHYLIAEK